MFFVLLSVIDVWDVVLFILVGVVVIDDLGFSKGFLVWGSTVLDGLTGFVVYFLGALTLVVVDAVLGLVALESFLLVPLGFIKILINIK